MTKALQRLDPAKREQLVLLAAEEFAAHGQASASLNRVLAAAGMSKSSFYHLLASKQELFDLAVGDLAAVVVKDLVVPNPQMLAGPHYWDRIDALVTELAGVLTTDDQALLLGRMVYATLDESPAPPEPVARIVDWLGEVLAVGRSSGQVRTDLPANLQQQLLIAVLRTLDEWSVRHMEEFTREQLTQLVTAQSALLHRMLAV